MSPPVLAGFAGVLVAAAATGMLAGRCVRRPHADVILWVLWSAATLGLTVALAAQSLGFATGFSPVTFRAIELCALLLVPLALAWGLVELVARNEAVRFGIRLVCGAVIVVGAVILSTDPLTAEPFGKSWPSAVGHAQPFSLYALDLAEGVAILAVIASVALALVRARKDSRPSVAAVGLLGLAVFMTVALRLSLPDSTAYPLLGLVAAGLVWFGMTRVTDVAVGNSDLRPSADPDSGPQARFGGPAAPGPAATAATAASPAARPYGRILIFTVLEDRVADFDRLAEQAAEEVGKAEPDTLVYVIHLVPNAPLQRIFYEIYRDQAAFEWHENQPYMKRFVAARRPCVLATNVIELRLKYAKIAPLPTPAPWAPASPGFPVPSASPGSPVSSAGQRPLAARPAGRRAPLAPLAPEQFQPLPPGGRRYGGG